MESQPSTLFLHGGPGLHCAVEREWFGDTLPVLWWDQPTVAESPAPFNTLVTHAAKQLEAMVDSTGGQVGLIAHSFGGQIATALIRKHPALISRITLLGCPHDRFQFFFLLAQRLLETGHEFPGLQDALAAVEENCDEASFFSLIQACYPGGNLPGIYFGPHSSGARNRYLSVLATAPPVDFATFFAVMKEFLLIPNSTQPTGYDGEVVIIMGRDDPLLDLEADRRKWLDVFPQANFKQVDAGHFLQFELPPDIWFNNK